MTSFANLKMIALAVTILLAAFVSGDERDQREHAKPVQLQAPHVGVTILTG